MRIAFLADLHFGSDGKGFCQQPIMVNASSDIVNALSAVLADQRVELVISGGDLVCHGSPESIKQVTALLEKIPLPMLLCLGNHDLADRRSLAQWQSVTHKHPRLMLADTFLETPACDIIGLNTHWINDGVAELYWNSANGPVPALTGDQLVRLNEWLARNPSRPAIVSCHAPLDPLPTSLTGLPNPIHESPEPYTSALQNVLAKYPRVKLLLTAHCHATCATPHGSYTHLSLAAISEVPNQYALVDVGPNGVEVSVKHLVLTTDVQFNTAKAWVSGRGTDCKFMVK